MKKILASIIIVLICSGCASIREKFNEAIGRGKESVDEKIEEVKDVVLDRDRPDNPDSELENLPFAWNEVEWCSGDNPIGDWDITVTLTGVGSGGGVVSWGYTAPLNWSTSNRIGAKPNAVAGFVVQINGKWCAAIGEWLPKGQTVQATKMFRSKREGDHKFGGSMRNFKPESGQELWFFVCGLNWKGLVNVQERSNLLKLVYKP